MPGDRRGMNDARTDSVGLQLEEEYLPKRIRLPKLKPDKAK